MSKLHIHYDAEGDFLQIRFGEVPPSYDEYIGDDTFERRDRKSDVVFGYAIYNVKKRKQPNDIAVPLPRML